MVITYYIYRVDKAATRRSYTAEVVKYFPGALLKTGYNPSLKDLRVGLYLYTTRSSYYIHVQSLHHVSTYSYCFPYTLILYAYIIAYDTFTLSECVYHHL